MDCSEKTPFPKHPFSEADLSNVGKRFNRSLVRTGVWRGFCNGPQNLKTAEIRRKLWKRAFLFSAPNSGMHQNLVQKRSDNDFITTNCRKHLVPEKVSQGCAKKKKGARNAPSKLGKHWPATGVISALLAATLTTPPRPKLTKCSRGGGLKKLAFSSALRGAGTGMS